MLDRLSKMCLINSVLLISIGIFAFVLGEVQVQAEINLSIGFNVGLNKLKLFKTCMQFAGQSNSKIIERDFNNTSSEYARHNLQWNLRKEKIYPLAYFVPLSSQDVSIAVRCASTAGICVVPNSGGHSYEAISFGNENMIVIDFINMRNITVIKYQGQVAAKIQPGALVGHVKAYLWENGGYFLPIGK